MNTSEIRNWLALRLPDGFYCEPPIVLDDAEELAILGSIPAPEHVSDPAERHARELACIAEHRVASRLLRTAISKELSKLLGKPVAWGACCGRSEQFFGSRRLPMVVRLDRTERRLLDLLFKGNIARSRSDAIAWVLRAIQEDRADWIADLRDTIAKLDSQKLPRRHRN